MAPLGYGAGAGRPWRRAGGIRICRRARPTTRRLGRASARRHLAAFRLGSGEEAGPLWDVSAPFVERIHEMRRQPGHRSGPDNKVRIGMPTWARLSTGRFSACSGSFSTRIAGTSSRWRISEAPSVTVTSAVYLASPDGATTTGSGGPAGFEDKRPPGRGRGLHIDAGCYFFDMKVIIYLSEVTDAADGAFNYRLGLAPGRAGLRRPVHPERRRAFLRRHSTAGRAAPAFSQPTVRLP